MPWLTITLADLNDYLVGAQVAALNSSALASGQSARFTNIMTDMVNRIRVKIESCPRNHISATPLTVPPELKWATCYLIIEALQSAIPALQLTEDQRNQIAKANTQLDRIANCTDAVTRPDDPLIPADVQRGGQAQLLTHSRPMLSRGETKRL
jgi:hypothetical protein